MGGGGNENKGGENRYGRPYLSRTRRLDAGKESGGGNRDEVFGCNRKDLRRGKRRSELRREGASDRGSVGIESMPIGSR